MATTRTGNLKLGVPAAGDRGWGPVMAANLQALDAAAPLGGLAVTPAEVPSSSTQIVVAPGAHRWPNGAAAALAAAATLTLPLASTRVVYINSAGAVTHAAAYPSEPHVRLATVATSSVVASIQDDRIAPAATVAAPVDPFTMTYATTDRTLPAYSANVKSTAFTGLDNAQTGTPYAKLADLNNLRVAYENLRAHAEAAAKVLNALVRDLQAMGIVK